MIRRTRCISSPAPARIWRRMSSILSLMIITSASDTANSAKDEEKLLARHLNRVTDTAFRRRSHAPHGKSHARSRTDADRRANAISRRIFFYRVLLGGKYESITRLTRRILGCLPPPKESAHRRARLEDATLGNMYAAQSCGAT